MTVPVYQWQPSTAEIARRAGISATDVIRFDHNTSPLGPEWAAAEAAAAAATVNEYPAADYLPLRAAAAAYAGVDPERIMVGAGADELILLCAQAFLAPGDQAVIPQPAYTMYRIATLRRGAEPVGVVRPAPEFRLPVSALAAAARSAAVVWLCEPDNPSGLAAGQAAVTEIAAASAGVVVVDAAYAEFAGDRWAPLVERHDNLVVLHTMSKAFGLASIRVGYSVSSPALTARLDSVRPPGSISTVSATLAIRALRDPDYSAGIVALIRAERTRLAAGLTALGVRVLPSITNFLLCEVGAQAHDVERRLMDRGLVVRKYPAPPLDEHLRFTVRSPAENDRLLENLEEVLT